MKPPRTTPMGDVAFWRIVDAARAKGPSAMAINAELIAQLRALDVDALRGYWARWTAEMDHSYDHEIWAAAYVIRGGCSDDKFRDFRASLILLGRDWLTRARRDPDSLIEVDDDVDLFHESYAYAFHDAWREKSGGAPLPPREEPHPAQPSGRDWEDDDLPARLPRLWARFGDAASN